MTCIFLCLSRCSNGKVEPPKLANAKINKELNAFRLALFIRSFSQFISPRSRKT